MSTITWLHISDLHFHTSEADDADVVLGELLSDIAERIAQDRLRPDFVAVTGDIAFSGQPAEYERAGRFFDELLETTRLTKNRLFLVPGNHDVDRGLVSEGAKTIGDSLKDRKIANAVLANPEDRKLMMDRFRHYAAFVNRYLADHLAFSEEKYYYVRTSKVGRRRIALLGLNSAWLATSDQDKANGLLVGERQARKALEQAQDADLKIALLHHPFDHLREFDRNDVEAMLLAKCDFVLHGHMHQTSASSLRDPDADAMVLSAGSCFDSRQKRNTYSFVQLNMKTRTGTVYLRRYSDERRGFWAKDVETYRNTRDGTYDFRFGRKPPIPAPPPRRGLLAFARRQPVLLSLTALLAVLLAGALLSFMAYVVIRGTATPTIMPLSTEFAEIIPVETLTDTPSASPKALAVVPTGTWTPTPTLTPAPPPTAGIRTRIRPGGMVMVEVPAGPFTMGSADDDSDAYEDERPQHTVTLDAFWIDRTEVTNAQFRECVKDGACQAPTECDQEGKPTYEDMGKADHPVVCVDWDQADAYCRWADARLPTEAEWEKAARGTKGLTFPWGNDFDCHNGNFDDEQEADRYVVPGGPDCDGYSKTAPVGSYPEGASPYKVLDMAGNVWEWVADWYDKGYYFDPLDDNPTGPSRGDYRVQRGASWSFTLRVARAALRSRGYPTGRHDYVGFRCADTWPEE